MLLSELGRGLAIGVIAVTMAFGRPMVALLMTVAVIEGVLEVFSQLARRASIRWLGRGTKPGLLYGGSPRGKDARRAGGRAPARRPAV